MPHPFVLASLTSHSAIITVPAFSIPFMPFLLRSMPIIATSVVAMT